MPESGFLFVWIFFLFFSEFSSPGWVWTEIGTKIFFLSSSAYLLPFWLKIIPERDFLIFLFFFLFFSKFSRPIRVWTEFGKKIFSLFLGLSRPILAKNNAGKGFFNFLIFFLYFFRKFLARAEYERNSGLKFFFSLSRPISSPFG